MSKTHWQICARDRKDRRGYARKNPMLGFRGCRLGCVRPEMTKMQTRALVKAAIDLRSSMLAATGNHGTAREHGGRVSSSARFDLGSRSRLRPRTKGGALRVLFAFMIETPKRAHRWRTHAAGASFFSFGTNDLTQMTYGLLATIPMPSYVSTSTASYVPTRIPSRRSTAIGAASSAIERARAVLTSRSSSACAANTAVIRNQSPSSTT